MRGRSFGSIAGLLIAGTSLAAFGGFDRPAPAPALHAAPIRKETVLPLPVAIKTWIVEQNERTTVYSNGLQIRADYLTTSKPRLFRTFGRPTLTPAGPFTIPAGIVFHTTESLLLPLEAERNGSLVRTREDLLRHVRDGRLYNFVIDRFGQVFRIVPEDQTAYHAGHSVWADANSIYEGLNESFLGVSFEARTGTLFEATAAQIQSGRMLTEVLRGTYGIPESNCVTHAQVSVNPDNMRFGYHTDWGANFPFRDFGLTTGYAAPVSAVALFGFEYDDFFVKSIGGHPWEGLLRAQENLQLEAQRQKMSINGYREQLQRQYRWIRSYPYERKTVSDRT